MKITISFILIFCFISFSCKTKKVTSPKAYEGKQLIFSHGGGFAGTYKTYYLLDNGQLFKNTNEFDKAQQTIGLSRDVTQQIFSNYEVMGLGDRKVESYGNLNYSITMIDDNGSKHKLVWEKGQKGAEKLQLYYKNVMSQIQKNNKKETEEVVR